MRPLSVSEFAQRCGISSRVARRAFNSGKWRGHHLPVSRIAGTKGGSSGSSYILHLDLCTPELHELLAEAETPSLTPVKQGFAGPLDNRQIAVARDRQAIIGPILNTKPGSAERGQAFREAAASSKISERALREWVTAAESAGSASLLPKPRSDRGQQRVQITRKWDQAVGLDQQSREDIAAAIELKARSMVANDGTSIREALRLCADQLVRASVAAGSPLPMQKLRKVCDLNRKWASRIGLDRFRLAYMYDKDHKAFQDEAVGRIRRDLHPIPMGLLVGDVHYVDMLVEEDGTTIRVRLIAWMDASSMFTWVTPVFLSPRIGIRQEDVAESLSQVAFCPHGGLPQWFEIDNGSEYSEIANTVMIRLAHLAQAEFGVTLAKPYSPTSKGDIEGYFNILEGIFKGLPGWIGGDRTNKKTANKGRVIAPYRHGKEALKADIEAAVAIYNDRPQSGRLQGLSPVQMLDRKIVETGFEARIPSEEAFDLIFSKPERRKVQQSMISIGGHQWHTPAFADLSGEWVDILIPLRANRERIWVRHEGKDCGWAFPEQRYQHGDAAGAKRQAELEAQNVAAVRKLKAQTDPNISTFELQKAAVRQIAPQTNAPEVWSMGVIDKTALPTPRDLEERENAERQALIDEFLAVNGPKERGSEGPAAATADPSCATA